MPDSAPKVETIRTPDGWWIRFDPTLIDQPRSSLFNPDWWRARGRLAGSAAGRGAVWFLENQDTTWALRHYRRGGLVGRIVHDYYLYTGRGQNRAWKELDITLRLFRQDLPVPRPVAAAMRRRGPWYTADLITTAIPDVKTLTQRLADESLGDEIWRAVGGTIRRFHEQGVHHADLNAHNILIDDPGSVWLIDFDKARVLSGGGWCEANLARLRRSLDKVSRADQASLIDNGWQQLRDGYGR